MNPLKLPEELQHELKAEANRLGLTLPEYVVRLLSTGRPMENNFKTGAELVDYWHSEGLIGTQPDIADSQEHARRLRDEAERRKQV